VKKWSDTAAMRARRFGADARSRSLVVDCGYRVKEPVSDTADT
jgi:hypothetical protein